MAPIDRLRDAPGDSVNPMPAVPGTVSGTARHAAFFALQAEEGRNRPEQRAQDGTIDRRWDQAFLRRLAEHDARVLRCTGQEERE